VDDIDRAEQFYRNVLGMAILGKELGRHVFFRVGVGSVLLAFNAGATLQGNRLLNHDPDTP
jgi:catechol 2,3-dioxygenase-like lactoylglutathione lyase family enzyme